MCSLRPGEQTETTQHLHDFIPRGGAGLVSRSPRGISPVICDETHVEHSSLIHPTNETNKRDHIIRVGAPH